jgi:hypothetical protein
MLNKLKLIFLNIKLIFTKKDKLRKERKKKRIMVNTEDLDFVGSGDFGGVYKLTPLTVVKVFHNNEYTEKGIKILVDDEIQGSKRPGCLPVLKKVKVLHNGEKTIGLVKRYIGKPVRYNEEFCNFRDKYYYWDIKESNCRKDIFGNIYIVDTQTKLAADAYHDGELTDG